MNYLITIAETLNSIPNGEVKVEVVLSCYVHNKDVIFVQYKIHSMIGDYYTTAKNADEFCDTIYECKKHIMSMYGVAKSGIYSEDINISDYVVNGFYFDWSSIATAISIFSIFNENKKNESKDYAIKENGIREIKTYLMKDCSNNFYKIGSSINPKHRERTLQSEKPTIKLVKVWNKNIEKLLHENYKEYRVRGEWFDLNEIQVMYMCKHY